MPPAAGFGAAPFFSTSSLSCGFITFSRMAARDNRTVPDFL
jgi:hypothetical protein